MPQKSVFGNTPTHKQYTVKYCTGVDIEFCILHKRVFDDIQEWSQTYQEPNDDKWMQWQKWLYAGLKAIQPTKEIRTILDVSTIAEYIQRVQPYPPFQEKFMLHDTDNNSVIRYSYMGIQGEYEYQTPIMESFQHFTSYFDINIYQMQERLQDFQDKIESCEHTLKNHFEKQQKRLTDLTEANLKQFEDTVNNKFDSIIQKRLANFDEILQQQLEYILIERKREYETQLTEIMDGVLQDLYGAADDGFAALRQAKMTELEDFKASLSEARNATTGATHTPFDPTATTVIRQGHCQPFHRDQQRDLPMQESTITLSHLPIHTTYQAPLRAYQVGYFVHQIILHQNNITMLYPFHIWCKLQLPYHQLIMIKP